MRVSYSFYEMVIGILAVSFGEYLPAAVSKIIDAGGEAVGEFVVDGVVVIDSAAAFQDCSDAVCLGFWGF